MRKDSQVWPITIVLIIVLIVFLVLSTFYKLSPTQPTAEDISRTGKPVHFFYIINTTYPQNSNKISENNHVVLKNIDSHNLKLLSIDEANLKLDIGEHLLLKGQVQTRSKNVDNGKLALLFERPNELTNIPSTCLLQWKDVDSDGDLDLLEKQNFDNCRAHQVRNDTWVITVAESKN